MDAKNIIYTSLRLANLDIDPNTNLEDILNAVDDKFGDVSGAPDYSTFTLGCITQVDGTSHPTTTKNFAEGISKVVCELKTYVEDFIETDYETDKGVFEDAISALQSPALVFAPFGIANTDLVGSVWNKTFTGIQTIITAANPSNASWDSIDIEEEDAPTTVTEGFNSVISYVADLAATVDDLDPLPTFNNVGSCIPSATASDTLVFTVNSLRTLVCSKPSFDIATIDWGCGIPEATNLQDFAQKVVDSYDSLIGSAIMATSSEFLIENVDVGNPCLGKRIIMKADASPRKTVAATSGATTFGSLYEVLTSDDDTIDIDNSSPNVLNITVNKTALADINDRKIIIDVEDDNPGYLGDKLFGGEQADSGVKINVRPVSSGPSCETGCEDNTKHIEVVPEIDPDALFNLLLTSATTNPNLIIKFKQMMDIAGDALTVAAPATGLTVTVL